MRSALEIVAFANNSKSEGIIALLDVALRALDEEGLAVIAIHVDMALALLKLDEAEAKVKDDAAAAKARSKRIVH